MNVMKQTLLFFLLLMTGSAAFAQGSDSTAKAETFEYEWAGEQITMQKYFIVFLKSGPNRSQSPEEAAELQEMHLAYLGGLYQKGIINLNGPSEGLGEIRGFSVYNVPTIEETVRLANEDPMVKAGRLIVEVHPWWLAKGSGVK